MYVADTDTYNRENFKPYWDIYFSMYFNWKEIISYFIIYVNMSVWKGLTYLAITNEHDSLYVNIEFNITHISKWAWTEQKI